MKRTLLLGAAGAAFLALGGIAAAQTASPTGGSSSGAYATLSPGNRSIVNALYDAQVRQPGTTRLSRNQIAAMKSGKGWGEVFHDMKAAGLTDARNLGNAVSDYRHHVNEERHELRSFHHGDDRHVVDRNARFADRDDHVVHGHEGYRESHATRALSATHHTGGFSHESHGQVTTALGATETFAIGGGHGGHAGGQAHTAGRVSGDHVHASVTTAGGRSAGTAGAAGAAHVTTAAGGRSGDGFHGGGHGHGHGRD